jgi:hypothetical protein
MKNNDGDGRLKVRLVLAERLRLLRNLAFTNVDAGNKGLSASPEKESRIRLNYFSAEECHE